SGSSNKKNAIIVENLLLKIQKARKQTQCQQCQNTEHNRA
ncbi:33804_t:CDS:2, partial [Gigaspora margarita]